MSKSEWIKNLKAKVDELSDTIDEHLCIFKKIKDLTESILNDDTDEMYKSGVIAVGPYLEDRFKELQEIGNLVKDIDTGDCDEVLPSIS